MLRHPPGRRELEDRRAEMARAQKLNEWRIARETVRAEMEAELAGDLSKEQEEALLANAAGEGGHGGAAHSGAQGARQERAAFLQVRSPPCDDGGAAQERARGHRARV